jgi:protein-disulfide isomerase
MRVAPTTIAVAAVSSLVTLCLTLTVTALAPISFRDRGLSDVQRSEIANIVKDQIREGNDAVIKAAREQSFSDTQRAEIARVMREQVRDNPDLVKEFLAALIKQRPAANTGVSSAPPNVDKSELIKSNVQQLFSSTHQVTLGNPQGDVTLVEFFDYNCGFCKRALADTLELLKSDPKLRVVLKELPVLGPGSLEAAKVAIAVRMQDSDGTKYLEFHQKLLAGGMPANKANALGVAQSIGLDIARLEQDANSEEVTATLNESRKLAQTLGINGTPSYVIGNKVVVGAVGLAALSNTIKSARN